ncbi:short-chain dehydrogenase/reductase SDR [Caldithrix abyssi DSM 13497]|uniref:3-oxoacyl-[acyl-carrier-protein] reductase n=1 Tax=Caldithrix abyssi DSM 13497 TaxID=880073 RepID=H1XYJ0_CALAY|nr:3-oxoacyl-[acyl-carrier-protein] reductase [Caldithrix abyssi]APF19691.1 3-oxoacyl-(acyl-carrier-protein) reductase [Caldithrix abyssi DSM 13497]EHO39808.1 short-chain dehydrogenase/reductase SDR [Caldithrix abyssi DSM 13497]
MNRLQSKIAIITGGASGIGLAAVKKFLNEGATVIVWDVQTQTVEAIIKEQPDYQRRLQAMVVDVADLQAVQRAAEEVFKRFGRIDILINNAGITRDATLLKMTAEQWQQVIDVNLTGVFNCSKAVAPYMVQQQAGKIINTSSVVGLYGNFGQTNYVAAKSGVIGMTRVWARELGRKGITVNAVAPGFIATEMTQKVPPNILENIKEKTPLKRLGQPEDIANAYCFLASDEADFINGAVLSVDGGLIL